jgi:predicted HicB family RNase H-like nuclease
MTTIYRGYAARIEYSAEDQCLIGHIAGIKDIVGFHDESAAGMHTAFEEAVDDYLDTCALLGRAAEQPTMSKPSA